MYAPLDNAGDTTLVTTKVKSELGVEGVDTSLNLSTLHSHKVIPVTQVDGLTLERPNRPTQVKLPKAYARDIIPSRKDQILTRAVADKWQLLKKKKGQNSSARRCWNNDRIQLLEDNQTKGINSW